MEVDMATETPPDYAATIRAEIEREVLQLRQRMERNGQQWHNDTWSADDVRAQYCTVGSMLNLHQGLPVLTVGDIVGGIPVRRIDRVNVRTIRVCADKVEFVREVEETDESGRTVTNEESFEKDLVEEARW